MAGEIGLDFSLPAGGGTGHVFGLVWAGGRAGETCFVSCGAGRSGRVWCGGLGVVWRGGGVWFVGGSGFAVWLRGGRVWLPGGVRVSLSAGEVGVWWGGVGGRADDVVVAVPAESECVVVDGLGWGLWFVAAVAPASVAVGGCPLLAYVVAFGGGGGGGHVCGVGGLGLCCGGVLPPLKKKELGRVGGRGVDVDGFSCLWRVPGGRAWRRGRGCVLRRRMRRMRVGRGGCAA